MTTIINAAIEIAQALDAFACACVHEMDGRDDEPRAVWYVMFHRAREQQPYAPFVAFVS